MLSRRLVCEIRIIAIPAAITSAASPEVELVVDDPVAGSCPSTQYTATLSRATPPSVFPELAAKTRLFTVVRSSLPLPGFGL